MRFAIIDGKEGNMTASMFNARTIPVKRKKKSICGVETFLVRESNSKSPCVVPSQLCTRKRRQSVTARLSKKHVNTLLLAAI